jgi:hypothetical protein
MAQLAHHVFFTLHDRNDSGRQSLLSACKKYLDHHDGVVSFAVGLRDPELNRPVNTDFDVSLHLVFATRADHDAYQIAQRHLDFIAEQKANWAEVRVFDSYLE